MAFSLKDLKKGKTPKPPRIVIYSEHGLGKSTFGSQAPKPVFIQTEDGLGSIDTTSFPLAKSYEDVKAAIGSLYNEEHDFQTVVLDSLDWLENLIWHHLAKAGGHESIEGYGYGKGYTLAADVLRETLAGLDALRNEKGMAVVLTAHTHVKRFDDPASEPYDRYMIKLHKAASAIVQEWADVVGFASQQMIIKSEDAGFNKKVRRGVSTGEHILHLRRMPAFDAKSRYPMPETIPFNWTAFADAFAAAHES